MRIIAIWVGKVLIWLMRVRGSGGSALPGLVIEKIYPNIISSLVSDLPDGAIMVTGTNGKTTTAKIIRTLLASDGREVIANRAGSNMSRGIAGALVEHCGWGGHVQGSAAVFEVDEAFVGDVAAKVRPKVLVVLNLARDQLDRYGELDRTARLIADGTKHAEHVVLNGDDPLVAGLSDNLSDNQVTFFGATDELRQQLPTDEELHGKARRSKVIKPEFQLVASQEKGQGQASLANALRQPADELRSPRGAFGQAGQVIKVKYQDREYSADIQLAGAYNAYNAVAALAACVQFGMKINSALNALPQAAPAFGRSETIEYKGKTLQLLLVKNPAGLNQIIETFLRKHDQPILFAVNDHIADGRDVSWLWDVDFERLSGTQRSILATGTRGYDLALRLKYAELTSDVELDAKAALESFVGNLKEGHTGFIVPTYTALLSIRKLLGRAEDLEEIWR